MNVPAVVQPHMEDNAASSAPTRFGEPMDTVDSFPGTSQMPQVTPQPWSCPLRLGLRKPRFTNAFSLSRWTQRPIRQCLRNQSLSNL